MTIWKSLENEKFGLMNGLSDLVAELEFNINFTFPDLSKSEKLYIFSDYGGEHKNSDFISYSFLITDFQSVADFCYKYHFLKDKFNLADRIISYKKLNDSIRFNALHPFLNLSENIKGFVVTVLIQKDIDSIFEKNIPENSTIDYSNWKPKDFEKLMRIVHLISLFISGISEPMQDICWITDQDNIVVNDQKLIDITQILGNVSSHYLTHDLGKLQCGRANIEKNNYFEILCAIPDLSAGAITELANYYSENNIFPNSQVIVPSSKNTKSKVNTIVYWFMNNQNNLKKLCISIEKGETSLFKMSHLKFHNLYNSLGL